MFGGDFWRSLRAEHLVLLLGWVIGGAIFWADTRTALSEQRRDIAKLQGERARDDDETNKQNRELAGSLADIKARLTEMTKAVDELKSDLRRGWHPQGQPRP